MLNTFHSVLQVTDWRDGLWIMEAIAVIISGHCAIEQDCSAGLIASLLVLVDQSCCCSGAVGSSSSFSSCSCSCSSCTSTSTRTRTCILSVDSVATFREYAVICSCCLARWCLCQRLGPRQKSPVLRLTGLCQKGIRPKILLQNSSQLSRGTVQSVLSMEILCQHSCRHGETDVKPMMSELILKFSP